MLKIDSLIIANIILIINLIKVNIDLYFFQIQLVSISTVINNPSLIVMPVAGAALVYIATGIGYFIYRYKKIISIRQVKANSTSDVAADGIRVTIDGMTKTTNRK